jgi:predicted nucleic acid-binding protein
MKFALDTNLYVHAFRDPASERSLRAFYERETPNLYLCSVVLHELEVGGSSGAAIDWVERTTRPVAASRRVITPTHAAWKGSGTALSRLASERHMERRNISRSLVHDALIAATCRENGVSLVTHNTRDFELIQSVIRFDFVAPWP